MQSWQARKWTEKNKQQAGDIFWKKKINICLNIPKILNIFLLQPIPLTSGMQQQIELYSLTTKLLEFEILT